MVITAVGRAYLSRDRRQAAKPGSAHQTGNAVATGAVAGSTPNGINRGSVNAGRPITAATLGMHQPDCPKKGAVLKGTRALRPRPPSIVAADGNAQNAAHQPRRPVTTILIHGRELHRAAAPKMSAAFFRMSRSACASCSSRLRRAFSAARSAGDSPGVSREGRRHVVNAVVWPNCRTHRRSWLSCTPSSAAT